MSNIDPSLGAHEAERPAPVPLGRLGGVALKGEAIPRGTVYMSFSELSKRHQQDPLYVATQTRRALRNLANDTSLPVEERRRRLSDGVDAYIDLSVRLDHAAYPPTTETQHGTPDYIPDGYVDMGPYSTPGRGREIIVDKAAILTKYRDVLLEVFGGDYRGLSSSQVKNKMADTIDHKIFELIPYNTALIGARGEMDLAKMDEGVCAHIMTAAQLLRQAVGITSRPFKCEVNGVRHAAIQQRTDNEWSIRDVTYPDFQVKPDGTTVWHPSNFPIGSKTPTRFGGRYEVTAPNSGAQLTYVGVDQEDHWRIRAPQP